MRPDERQHGVPSHWNLYVTVANVDDAVGAGAVAMGEATGQHDAREIRGDVAALIRGIERARRIFA